MFHDAFLCAGPLSSERTQESGRFGSPCVRAPQQCVQPPNTTRAASFTANTADHPRHRWVATSAVPAPGPCSTTTDGAGRAGTPSLSSPSSSPALLLSSFRQLARLVPSNLVLMALLNLQRTSAHTPTAGQRCCSASPPSLRARERAQCGGCKPVGWRWTLCRSGAASGAVADAPARAAAPSEVWQLAVLSAWLGQMSTGHGCRDDHRRPLLHRVHDHQTFGVLRRFGGTCLRRSRARRTSPTSSARTAQSTRASPSPP